MSTASASASPAAKPAPETNDDFIPARPSPLVQGFFRTFLPFLLPRLGVVGVHYDEEDLARLRALGDKSVLLLPNHPTNTEPALLFHLSATLKRSFYYLACRESFDPLWGFWGKIIRRVGAFSVVRGTADRASFRATRELLAQPGGASVVIFPEGEVYSQNDSLLPFHTGVFQLAFWAMDDKRKAGLTEGEDAALFLVPVALKYHYTRDMSVPIAQSLLRLEKFTGVPPAPSAPPYDRLRRVGLAMLQSLEREYRLPVPKTETEADLSPRLNAIKEAILQRVALAAGVPVPKGETLPERMRGLLHAVEMVEHNAPEKNASPYDKSLRDAQRLRAQPLLRDLERLANWIAVYDGYVKADPTPERMADTLIRLERECWGKAKLHGPKACRVRIGEPLNLRDCREAYEENKRAEVLRVTREIEKRVGDLLCPPARNGGVI